MKIIASNSVEQNVFTSSPSAWEAVVHFLEFSPEGCHVLFDFRSVHVALVPSARFDCSNVEYRPVEDERIVVNELLQSRPKVAEKHYSI
jgi:hypothetical protein